MRYFDKAHLNFDEIIDVLNDVNDPKWDDVHNCITYAYFILRRAMINELNF